MVLKLCWTHCITPFWSGVTTCNRYVKRRCTACGRQEFAASLPPARDVLPLFMCQVPPLFEAVGCSNTPPKLATRTTLTGRCFYSVLLSFVAKTILPYSFRTRLSWLLQTMSRKIQGPQKNRLSQKSRSRLTPSLRKFSEPLVVFTTCCGLLFQRNRELAFLPRLSGVQESRQGKKRNRLCHSESQCRLVCFFTKVLQTDFQGKRGNVLERGPF